MSQRGGKGRGGIRHSPEQIAIQSMHVGGGEWMRRRVVFSLDGSWPDLGMETPGAAVGDAVSGQTAGNGKFINIMPI